VATPTDSSGGVGGGAGNDIVPDPFNFNPRDNLPVSLWLNSNAVTITGINAPAPVTVTGGYYAIGCQGVPSNTPGTIQNGQTICVAHFSASTPNAKTTTTLTIGGISAEFVTTTVGYERMPRAFVFKAAKRVKPNALVKSNTVKISGIQSGAAPIAVTNGEYSIGCNARTFTKAAGTVKNNQKVCVRLVSASAPKSTVSATLSVGGASGRFSATTK
jgi:hypothetical protein